VFPDLGYHSEMGRNTGLPNDVVITEICQISTVFRKWRLVLPRMGSVKKHSYWKRVRDSQVFEYKRIVSVHLVCCICKGSQPLWVTSTVGSTQHAGCGDGDIVICQLCEVG
jgi:hypothetical protein